MNGALNKKAFDLGTVSVSHYDKKNADPEELSKVDAAAYNLENGQVIATRLDQKDLFSSRKDEYETDSLQIFSRQF